MPIGSILDSVQSRLQLRAGDNSVHKEMVFVAFLAAAVIFSACDTAQPTETGSSVTATSVPSPEPSVTIPIDVAVEVPAILQTKTPMPSPTPTFTVSPTHALTASIVPTATSTPSPATTSLATSVPSPTPTLAVPPTLAPTPVPTEIAVPTPSPSPTSAPVDAQETATPAVSTDIDGDANWGDVVGELSKGEQRCIREAITNDEYETLLEQSPSEYDVSVPWLEPVWDCLSQGAAVELTTNMWVSELGIDGTRRDPEVAERCVEALFETMDIPTYVSALNSETSNPRNDVAWSLYFEIERCLGHGTGYLTTGAVLPFNLRWDSTMLWADFAQTLTEDENLCVETSVDSGQFNGLQNSPIFDGSTEPWEVDVWRCLTQETAEDILSQKLKLDYKGYFQSIDALHEASRECARTDVFKFKCLLQFQSLFSMQPVDSEIDLNDLGLDDAECLQQTLARIDFPRMISGGLSDATLGDAMYAVGTRAAIAMCVQFYLLVGRADDHGQDFDDATPLVLGETAKGELIRKLDFATDIDLFSFVAESGRSYQIDIDLGDADGLMTITLLDSEGVELATTAADWSTDGAQITWQSETSSVHYLGLLDLADYLSYSVTIRESTYADDHGGTPETATVIADDHRVDGEIGVAFDVDYFTFKVQEGLTYLIEIDADIDITRTLLNEDGIELVARDDIWEGSQGLLQWQAASTEQLYVVIEGDHDAIGGYSVTVSQSEDVDDHGDTFETATDISDGSSFSGEIGTHNDIDIFTFLATSGSSFELDFAYNLGDGVAVYEIVLYDGHGVEVRRNSYDPYGSTARIILSNLKQGTYYLSVSVFDNRVGKYEMALVSYQDDHGDSPQTATNVTLGDEVSGKFHTEYEFDYFRFGATARQAYRFSVPLEDWRHVWSLVVDAQDQPMFRGRVLLNYPESKRLWLEMRPQKSFVWIAPDAANYYLVLAGYQDEEYSFTIEPIEHIDDHGDDPSTATDIPVGESIDGALIDIDDIDYFRIAAEAGKRYKIEFDLEERAGVQVQVFDPNGEIVSNVEPDSGQPIRYYAYDLVPNQTGQYHIAISALLHAAYTVKVRERFEP